MSKIRVIACQRQVMVFGKAGGTLKLKSMSILVTRGNLVHILDLDGLR